MGCYVFGYDGRKKVVRCLCIMVYYRKNEPVIKIINNLRDIGDIAQTFSGKRYIKILILSQKSLRDDTKIKQILKTKGLSKAKFV